MIEDEIKKMVAEVTKHLHRIIPVLAIQKQICMRF
jgi:hypothetical protein